MELGEREAEENDAKGQRNLPSTPCASFIIGGRERQKEIECEPSRDHNSTKGRGRH